MARFAPLTWRKRYPYSDSNAGCWQSTESAAVRAGESTVRFACLPAVTVRPIGEVPLVIALAGNAVLKPVTSIANVIARAASRPRRGFVANTVSRGNISLAVRVTGPIADRADGGVDARVCGATRSIGAALTRAPSKQAQTSYEHP